MRSLGAIHDDHRQVSLYLHTILLSLHSCYRVLVLAGLCVTDGCVALGYNKEKYTYTVSQGLLMSILAKHRCQTHASIVELAVKLGLAEGLGSSIRWTFSHGYGSLIVNFSGWPTYRLCEAVSDLLPRKGFQPNNTESWRLMNNLLVEEAPAVETSNLQSSISVVLYTANGPADFLLANGMRGSFAVGKRGEEALLELLGWDESIPYALKGDRRPPNDGSGVKLYAPRVKINPPPRPANWSSARQTLFSNIFHNERVRNDNLGTRGYTLDWEKVRKCMGDELTADGWESFAVSLFPHSFVFDEKKGKHNLANGTGKPATPLDAPPDAPPGPVEDAANPAVSSSLAKKSPTRKNQRGDLSGSGAAKRQKMNEVGRDLPPAAQAQVPSEAAAPPSAAAAAPLAIEALPPPPRPWNDSQLNHLRMIICVGSYMKTYLGTTDKEIDWDRLVKQRFGGRVVKRYKI